MRMNACLALRVSIETNVGVTASAHAALTRTTEVTIAAKCAHLLPGPCMLKTFPPFAQSGARQASAHDVACSPHPLYRGIGPSLKKRAICRLFNFWQAAAL